MNSYNKKAYIIILIILVIVFGGFVIYYNYINNNEKHISLINYEMHDKVYGVNEYSNVVVSDQKMSSIYLANYLYLLRTDLEKAYNLVDDDYIKKYNLTYQEFVNYVNSINVSDTKVSEYSVINNDDMKQYIVINSSGNLFSFITDGVMTYTVKFSQ